MHFQIYSSPNGYRWRLRTANNEIVAQGEAYTRKRDALRAVTKLRDQFLGLEDIPVIERLK